MMRPIASTIALLALLPLAACSSTSLPSIGSIGSGLSGNKISETDRVFLVAAGSWDRNHDNQITCDEWKAYTTELFDGADANRDDMVDATEWSSIVAIDRMFSTANLEYYDKSSDGKVSRAEFVDAPNPAFQLLNASQTCVLTGAQVAGARSKTEYDVSGKPPESGDVREKNGSDQILGR